MPTRPLFKLKPPSTYGIKKDKNRWQVCILRQGTLWTKSFSYAVYGGRAAALIEAQTWRDAIVSRYPPELRRQRWQRLIGTNKSGIAGVVCKVTSAGVPWLWIAKTVFGPDRILFKSFSVGRFGEQARTMAIAERARQLRYLEGRVFVHPAEERLRTSRRKR